MKSPADHGTDHWCLAHYLLDGHHKIAAAARRQQPVTLVAFVAVEQGISTEAEANAALTLLQASP